MADLDGFSATRQLAADEATTKHSGDRRDRQRVRRHAAGGARGRLRRVPAEAGARRSVVRRAADAPRRRVRQRRRRPRRRRPARSSPAPRHAGARARGCARRRRSARSPISQAIAARARRRRRRAMPRSAAASARSPRASISTACASWPPSLESARGISAMPTDGRRGRVAAVDDSRRRRQPHQPAGAGAHAARHAAIASSRRKDGPTALDIARRDAAGPDAARRDDAGHGRLRGLPRAEGAAGHARHRS